MTNVYWLLRWSNSNTFHFGSDAFTFSSKSWLLVKAVPPESLCQKYVVLWTAALRKLCKKFAFLVTDLNYLMKTHKTIIVLRCFISSFRDNNTTWKFFFAHYAIYTQLANLRFFLRGELIIIWTNTRFLYQTHNAPSLLTTVNCKVDLLKPLSNEANVSMQFSTIHFLSLSLILIILTRINTA